MGALRVIILRAELLKGSSGSSASNSQSSHCFPLEASARRVIMVAWMIAGPSEANIFVARDPFNNEMLRIVLSEFDKIQKEHTRDIDL